MTTMTDIATDLMTPLGAYLRLRRRGAGSFLLESVERGRLGRYSFVGSGAEIVSFEEAEKRRAPVVGYLGYDNVVQEEPTVPLPDDGPGLPESRFVVPDVLLRFDHPRGSADVLCGDAEEITELLAPPVTAETNRTAAGESLAVPSRADYEASVRLAMEHIVAGDVFQVVLSQRVERVTSASAVDLYRALRRVNPSPYLFLRVPDEFEVSATAPDGEVMAMRHRTLPVDGIQFHPESILTPLGPRIAQNFLEGQ
jgi:anthranilate synthase component 1